MNPRNVERAGRDRLEESRDEIGLSQMSMRRSGIEGIVKALCRWRDVQVAFASPRVGERAFESAAVAACAATTQSRMGRRVAIHSKNSRCFGMSLTNPVGCVSYDLFANYRICLCS